MDKQSRSDIKKPKPVWKRPVDINFTAVGASLAKVGSAVLLQQWINAAEGVVDIASSIGLSKPNTYELAWLLLYRSLLNAMVNLANEYPELTNKKVNVSFLYARLDLALEEAQIDLDANFFLRPKELPILDVISEPYYLWLRSNGLSESNASAITDRLPQYFIYELNFQWGRNKDLYADLANQFETPFSEAKAKEISWERYNSWLRKIVDAPMFGEAFSIRQIYIPLRAYYVQKKRREGPNSSNRQVRTVVDLEEALNDWLEKKNKEDAIRVICGGPGCGKSSFAKIWAAKLTESRNISVLLIPLFDIDPSKDLCEAIDDWIQTDLENILPPNPVSRGNVERRVLLIFDGLDELALQGSFSNDVARSFITELQQKLLRFNYQSLRVQVLISSRELVIQGNQDRFRQIEQILYLLPYFQEKSELGSFNFVEDDSDLLAIDQRNEWWSKYGALTGLGYESLPDELSQKELTEITSQPLLNYFFALGYISGDFDIVPSPNNLTTTYENLVGKVYERMWERYCHPTLGDISKDNFIRVLEEISIACWHSNSSTATMSEIQKRCSRSSLKRNLSLFEEGAKEGIARLLTSFYFRQHAEMRNSEHTFEFTHQSFGEYLTAKRIIREIRTIDRQLSSYMTDDDGGWDERECLKHWLLLCGASPINEYIFRFVVDALRGLSQSGLVLQLQATVSTLMSYVLKHGMPIERLEYRQHHKKETDLTRNAKESLLALLNACGQTTKNISFIDWPSEEAFGTLISKLQPQRIGYKNAYTFDCLSYLELSNCNLLFKDLYAANLEFSCLEKANLEGANLGRANLRRAELKGVILSRANLRRARLEGANLERAYLEEANLTRATLANASLRKAQLLRTSLNFADLCQVDLTQAALEHLCLQDVILNNAIIIGARINKTVFQNTSLVGSDLAATIFEFVDLSSCQLIGANLSFTTLCEVNLSDANLLGVNLSNSTLSKVKLQNAKMLEANLENSVMTDVDLRGANLEGANLGGANLEGANLEGANLEGANLKGTILNDAQTHLVS